MTSIIDKLIQSDREEPRRILVVGDCMFDIYVSGTLYPTCQEGCQKFVEESVVTVLGGAGNAARSIENWNAQVVCLPGRSPGIPEKTRFMVGDTCVFRYDNDMFKLKTGMIHEEAYRVVDECKPSAILLSDYDKGILTQSFIGRMIELANSRHIPIVVDPKRHPAIYEGAIIKSNHEWSHKFKHIPHVMTHRAARPIIDKSLVGPKLPEVNCVNHVGAGDCFAAHLTLALAYGFSLKDAAVVAHSAGRVYVQHPHNRPPTIQEIRSDLGAV